MSTDPINRIISLIFTTQRLVLENTKDRDRIDIQSLLQLEALRYIAEKQNPSMHEVADFFRITPPSATSLIDCLVKNGQLHRIKDSKDRRIIRLALTLTGKKSMETGFRKINSNLRRTFARLSAREQKHLVAILKELSQTFNK